ncbi:MAG: general secretion pathway protein GspK [Deltaproteobacteria bacterium]|nr:general secretion pathway protein GspK [Deltaproteobacteria bacterium]
MRMPKTDKGVAVLLVLGALFALATLAADFAMGRSVDLRLATAARDRLQAEYLATSAVNFLRLELKIERSAKSLFAQLPTGTQGIGTGPLCKQYPISTGLLKAIFFPGGEGQPVGSETAEKAAASRMVNVFETETAQAFLQFRGDFAGECEDEGGKLNLNVFAGLNPLQQTLGGLNAYDRFKEIFTTFLGQERFKEYLGAEDADPQLAREAVRNMADWVDPNETINEKGGGQGGPESALYGGTTDYSVRNGKMLTLDEAYLVAGVTDGWFTPLKRYFTVYGETKINRCSAAPEVVEAVVTAYALGNPKFPAFTPTNAELMKKITEAVAFDCNGAQVAPQKVAQDIESLLSGGILSPSEPQPTNPVPAPTGVSTATGSLAELIATEARFYRLIGTGEVGETGVRIETVVDVKEGDPKKWKMLYWHLE